MSRIYSTYEAKSRFSDVIRQVRSGRSVVIAYRGEPVAEIRPFAPVGSGLEGRLERLRAQGALVARPGGAKALRPVARRRGALARFLAERE